MNGMIQVFSHEQFGQVRMFEINGEPWAIAADVCKALDITNPTMVMSRLDEDEKAKFNLGLPGGETNCVNESGIYELIFGSRKREAKAFKQWVKRDILPSIRKTGTYTAGQSDEESDDIAIFNGYKALMRKVERLEAKVEADKPKVDFADALLVCDNCSYIEELAKHLCQIGMRTGRNRLIAEMAEDGFLCIRNGVKNMPTQKCVESGWLVIERKPHFEGDRSVMGYTTKVTPNGMQHFIEYYMRKHGLLPLLTTARQRQPRHKATSMSGYEKRDNWR